MARDTLYSSKNPRRRRNTDGDARSKYSAYEPAYGEPVRSPQIRRTQTMDDDVYATYNPNNVGGYRRQAEVNGYYRNYCEGGGQAMRDRQQEYSDDARSEYGSKQRRYDEQRSNPERKRTNNIRGGYDARRGTSTGLELVPYNNALYDENEDHMTIVPDESISNVSSNRSRPSTTSRSSAGSNRSDVKHWHGLVNYAKQGEDYNTVERYPRGHRRRGS